MELNGSTFLLEMINFLVLVWILKRFLYRPALDALDRRRAGIEQTLTNAQTLHQEAEQLRHRYESRLEDWSQERDSLRASLQQELAGEKDKALAALRLELTREREKARVLDELERADQLGKFQEISLQQGARFVARLLSALHGPELEAKLCDLTLTQLADLPEETRRSILVTGDDLPQEALIRSAYPVDPSRRQRLSSILEDLLGKPVTCSFVEDPELLSGLSIQLGPWVFQGNLRDELNGFADSIHAER